jgi:hypothetical protein
MWSNVVIYMWAKNKEVTSMDDVYIISCGKVIIDLRN